MCASDAAKAIASLDGVHHVRVDRLRGTFVVRHDPSLTDPSTISACVVDAGLHPA
jgi:copper chaperone CopZ